MQRTLLADRRNVSFKEEIEELSFNLVIDFPERELPRFRVYLLDIDDAEDCIMPIKVLEFPDADICHTVAHYIRTRGRFPALTPTTDTQTVSIMIPGITEIASYIYGWSSEYEKQVGVTLFPSPKSLARTITTELIRTLAINSGTPFLSTVNIVLNFSDEEEEYRPGIYL